jgi:hypothetical protein
VIHWERGATNWASVILDEKRSGPNYNVAEESYGIVREESDGASPFSIGSSISTGL